MKIVDGDTGYSFSFLAEEQLNGSLFLDCGNLGECYLQSDQIETVVDAIDAIFLQLDNITESIVEEAGN